MMRRFVVFWFLLGSSVYAQAKVGTTGAQFLELPLSVQSAGMGNVGTVLIDGRSYLVNPATLGFIGPRRTSIQFDPMVFDLDGSDVSYYSISAASRIRGDESGGPAIGVGARFLRLTPPSMYERTYESGVDYPGAGGSEPSFTWNDTKVGMAVGLKWSGALDFGVGLGLNYVGEYVNDYDANAWSADAGVFFGIPLGSDKGSSLKPPRILIGAAMVNMGPDIKFIEKPAPLPRYLRLGYGVELVWRSADREQLKLTPAIEYQRQYGGEKREVTNLGLEGWVQELLCGRVGYQTSNGADKNKRTWGLGFSTVGLRSHTQGSETEEGRGFFSFIVDNVDVQLSYAHQSPILDGWDATDFYGLELLF